MTRVNVKAVYMIITGFHSSVCFNGDFKNQFENKTQARKVLNRKPQYRISKARIKGSLSIKWC